MHCEQAKDRSPLEGRLLSSLLSPQDAAGHVSFQRGGKRLPAVCDGKALLGREPDRLRLPRLPLRKPCPGPWRQSQHLHTQPNTLATWPVLLPESDPLHPRHRPGHTRSRSTQPRAGQAGLSLCLSGEGRNLSHPALGPGGLSQPLSSSTPILLLGNEATNSGKGTAGFGEATPLIQRTSSLTSSASTAGLAVLAWHLYVPGLLCPCPLPACVDHSGFPSRVWLAWSPPGSRADSPPCAPEWE